MNRPPNDSDSVGPAYLQMAAQVVAPIKQRSYEQMHISPGHHVLDVGCGPATDTVPLARWVGLLGRVVGVDSDEAMIATANQMAAKASVSDRVTHQLGDALSLSFPDDRFNSCRCERLFQHLKAPQLALAEMARVTVPDGWIVAVETDQASLAIDTTNSELLWRIARFRTEQFGNGYAGRQLYGLFKRQHLLDIQVEIVPIVTTDYLIGRYLGRLDWAEHLALDAGIVTVAELERWHSDLEERETEGRFFGYLNMVLVAGRKTT